LGCRNRGIIVGFSQSESIELLTRVQLDKVASPSRCAMTRCFDLLSGVLADLISFHAERAGCARMQVVVLCAEQPPCAGQLASKRLPRRAAGTATSMSICFPKHATQHPTYPALLHPGAAQATTPCTDPAACCCFHGDTLLHRACFVAWACYVPMPRSASAVAARDTRAAPPPPTRPARRRRRRPSDPAPR
jgi:hypothetical protein